MRVERKRNTADGQTWTVGRSVGHSVSLKRGCPVRSGVMRCGRVVEWRVATAAAAAGNEQQRLLAVRTVAKKLDDRQRHVIMIFVTSAYHHIAVSLSLIVFVAAAHFDTKADNGKPVLLTESRVNDVTVYVVRQLQNISDIHLQRRKKTWDQLRMAIFSTSQDVWCSLLSSGLSLSDLHYIVLIGEYDRVFRQMESKLR